MTNPSELPGESEKAVDGEPLSQERAQDVRAARKLAVRLAEVGLERKALNVEIIDVVGKVDYADFVVVMSGRSDRQVAALAKNIEGDLREEQFRCLSVEGLPRAAWVLMDYGDVIVHIFHQDTRGYYDLESLWMDAPRIPIPH